MSAAPPRDPIPVLAELPLEIDTPRLHLRPQRESDAEPLFRYTSEPTLTPYVTWATHTNVEETRQWLRDGATRFAAGTHMVWTIEHDGKPCGAISLLGITWAVRAVRWDRAELGYWIGVPLWGKGLMTEAAVAVTRWAFETLGLHRVTVGCIAENVGSRRVIEKVGYRFLCKQEEDAWKDGRWLDHLRFELTVGEWTRLASVVP